MASTPDTKYYQNIAGPATTAIAVTPSNVTTFEPCRGLWIGATGNVAITDLQGNSATFVAAQAGSIIPIQCTQVLSTGTTATSILRLF